MMLLGGVVAPTAQAEGKRKAWSAADGAFYLKTYDGLETYEVDGTITFKAVATAAWCSHQRMKATRFKSQ